MYEDTEMRENSIIGKRSNDKMLYVYLCAFFFYFVRWISIVSWFLYSLSYSSLKESERLIKYVHVTWFSFSSLFNFIFLLLMQKEKTIFEVLEELETKIKDIESFSISTQARQKRFVGSFLVFSVGLYVIASVVFYFAFFPSTWSKRIIYSTPLLIFPIL